MLRNNRLLTALFVIAAVGLLLTAVSQGPAHQRQYGFGEEVDEEEIESFNIHPAIPPDGSGLPLGSGTVAEGAEVYAQKCAHCHGPTGREGPFDILVGPDDEVMGFESSRNIGNYWPYATTVYDYIRRAMPFDNPGTLTPDEVYAVTAWLLHQNEVVPEDAVMNAETLPQVEMPARDMFVPDPRPLEGP